MADVGRPSQLTEELTLKIRAMVLEGKTYIDIQNELQINSNNWDTWVYKDYQGFRTSLNNWKKERLIKKAEKISDEILDLIVLDNEGKTDPNLLRIKQKEAEFIRSTLAKLDYSTKTETEQTGTIQVNVTNYTTLPVQSEELSTTVPTDSEKV